MSTSAQFLDGLEGLGWFADMPSATRDAIRASVEREFTAKRPWAGLVVLSLDYDGIQEPGDYKDLFTSTNQALGGLVDTHQVTEKWLQGRRGSCPIKISWGEHKTLFRQEGDHLDEAAVDLLSTVVAEAAPPLQLIALPGEDGLCLSTPKLLKRAQDAELLFSEAALRKRAKAEAKLARLRLDTEPRALAWCADTDSLVVGDGRGRLYVWPAERRPCRRVEVPSGDRLIGACVRGGTVFAAGQHGALFTMSLPDGAPQLHDTPTPDPIMWSLAVSADGERAFVGGFTRVGIVDVFERGRKGWKRTHSFQADPQFLHWVLLADDDQTVLTGGREGKVHAWTTAGEHVREYDLGGPAWVTAGALTPDGTAVAAFAARKESRIVLVDLGTGEVRADRPAPPFMQDPVLAFAPGGQLVVCGGAETRVIGRVWIYDLETGDRRKLEGLHELAVLAAVVSPQGDVVATTSADKTLALTRLADGERLAVLRGDE